MGSKKSKKKKKAKVKNKEESQVAVEGPTPEIDPTAYQPRPWTDEEEQVLCTMRSEGIEYKYIGLELKRTSNSCRKKWKDTVWTTKPWYDTLQAMVRANVKKAHLDHVLRASDRRVERTKVRMDIIADRLATAVQAIPKIPKPFVRRKKKAHSPEDVGLIISDCHIGHGHTLEETGGLSEYNLDVFRQRAENLKYAIGDIHELHSQLYKLPTLHIMCIGDIVAGMNNTGNWSSVYITSDIHQQAVIGCEALADIIHYALHLFEEVKFYGVYGNHGRGAMKGLEKEYVNWDFICYEFLTQRFRDNDRVSFVVPKTWWLLEEIRSHKFLILHGDDVRSSGGAPLGGVIKCQNDMMTILKQIPDYTVIGHFHSAGEWTTNNGKILVNGSFIGPDIYALKNLQKGARPEQKIFGIHDKRGLTWRYDIDLDIPR